MVVLRLAESMRCFKNLHGARDKTIEELDALVVAEDGSTNRCDLHEARECEAGNARRENLIEIEKEFKRVEFEECGAPVCRDLNGCHVIGGLVS